MPETKILISGFGGQGILFLGKLIASAGLLQQKEVSWLPSYGPEMRGGTANCSVIISNNQIGSPIVSSPDVLISMNLPSFDKYENTVAPKGCIFFDSSLITKTPSRKDIDYFSINATTLASENDLQGLANMIILGKILKERPFISRQTVEITMEKLIRNQRPELIEKNLKAIKLGYEN